MSRVFCVKHFKGKKKEEIQKTKLPTHVERNNFFEEKHQPTRKLQISVFSKKNKTRKQRREISILSPKVADSGKTQRKVNEKGRKDALEKVKDTKEGISSKKDGK